MIRILGMLVWALSVSASAVEVKNLFEVEVIAESTKSVDRDRAIRRGLVNVLRRVLAAPEPLDDQVVQTAVDNALFYARQYQFALSEVPGFPESARRLRVVFDASRLLDLLKSSRYGVWNEIRPDTLLWLVIENERGERRFFGAERDFTLKQDIAEASERQGLPLVFPLLDLSERQSLRPNDVLSAYPDKILSVSGRYDVVSILVGRLVEQEGCWYSEWSHYFDHQVRQWRHDCESRHDNLASGLRGAYLRLAEFYGVKPEMAQPGSAVISVAGILGVDDAGAALSRLQRLPGVRSVSWLSVDGEFHRYRLDYDGEAITLRQAIERSGHFQALPGGLAGREWYYRLIR